MVSPPLASFLRRFVAPLVRLMHRPEVHGLSNLPEEGPYLLVANHSAAGAEVVPLFVTLLERRGAEQRLAGFTNPAAFRLPGARGLTRRLGVVPATYDHAASALAAGVPLLIFPGGLYEEFRPVWRANQVDFNGREGYLRIALRAGVPIVPMGIRGSHVAVPILWRSRLLANLLLVPRLAGFRRWPLTVVAVVGAVGLLAAPIPLPLGLLAAWLWVVSPFALLPVVPSTITIRVGRPMAPSELFPDGALGDAGARVEAAVQALVTPPPGR